TKSGGGERDTVVGSNGLGQTVLAKEAFECELDGNLFGRSERLAGENVSAVLISHRQRVAVFAVAGQELAFEVSRPKCVRRGGGCGGLAWMFEPSTASPHLAEAGALQ